MSDNYVSPYGFSTVTDTCLDAIAIGAGRDLEGFAAAIDDLEPEQRERFDTQVENWRSTALELALDKLVDIVGEFVELDPDVIAQVAMLESGQSVLGPR